MMVEHVIFRLAFANEGSISLVDFTSYDQDSLIV